MELGRVLVFQPAYANGVPASHRAFWVGAAKPGDKCWGRINFLQFGGSLLASCFNKAWCAALNLQREGEDITHFAMLHDDVVPEDGWLEQLLKDMKESDADLVS